MRSDLPMLIAWAIISAMIGYALVVFDGPTGNAPTSDYYSRRVNDPR